MIRHWWFPFQIGGFRFKNGGGWAAGRLEAKGLVRPVASPGGSTPVGAIGHSPGVNWVADRWTL